MLVTMVASLLMPISASAQTGAGVNQIAVRAQETNTGQIMVDSVTAAQDGWVVLYFMSNLDPLTVVGLAPVHKGVNTNVKVNIDSALADPYPTLWAVLHADKGAVGTFEWPGADEPVYQNGAPIMTAFGTQAPAAVAAAPQAPSPVAAAEAPKILPVAGGLTSPWSWLAPAALGAVLLAMGLALSRARARG
jgi:hypothetical protein